jgi:hypothetical protein
MYIRTSAASAGRTVAAKPTSKRLTRNNDLIGIPSPMSVRDRSGLAIHNDERVRAFSQQRTTFTVWSLPSAPGTVTVCLAQPGT